MYKGSTVGVVVPAYNEQGFVGTVIETIPAFVDRIYVVDDCSTDGTWAEIQHHAATADPVANATFAVPDGGAASVRRVVPIRHEHNRGVGGAIGTGYRRARTDGIDVTAVMAGDGQMDPDQLDRLIDPVVDGAADYAKGNRLLHRPHREAMSPWRCFGNSLLTLLTRVASGYWRTGDPQNGYTAISREALSSLDLSALYEGYGFLNDLLIRLNARELRVADVGMPAVYGEERSTINYSQFVPALSALLLRGFLWRMKRKYVDRGIHPVALASLFGVLGVGSGTLPLVRSLLSTDDSEPRVLRIGAGVLAVLVGWACFLMAVTFDRWESEEIEEEQYR
jgi:glycosyltransferase involved in cell wall biosynthesis